MSRPSLVVRLLMLAAAPAALLLGCDEIQLAPAEGDGPSATAEGDGDSDGANSSESIDGLTIGSKAPPLSIEHWFDSELGDKPIEKFKAGDVYMVEFWATWCPPCVASMPHLAELQKEYADQGVTIVSVSDEPVETVEEFLGGEVRNYEGDAEQTPTYDELTSAYRLTTDPDGSMSENWMQAAAQRGIPTSFLVGKTGRIEWIGHPMAVDSVLAEVVEGTWDREAFGRQFREQQRLDLFRQDMMAAMRSGGPEKALQVIEEFRASAESEQALAMADQLQAMVEKQVFLSQLGEDPQQDLKRFEEMLAPIKDDINEVNEMTWTIYRYADAGRGVDKELLQAASDAAEAALELEGPKGSLLDTIAHLQHELGNLDRAIEVQSRAVEQEEIANNPAAKEQLQQYLEELKAERDGGEQAEGGSDEQPAGDDSEQGN
ncbi:TlpA disulfide reductase family protein [Botrimarina sp.]|uniref:TlpA disulfide reductase family protein n=1 Tax=Botrimarina sp. TaxID=2795802 RepID=UPI0032F03356